MAIFGLVALLLVGIIYLTNAQELQVGLPEPIGVPSLPDTPAVVPGYQSAS